jgi:ABC-type transporter Mla subunit MlaD
VAAVDEETRRYLDVLREDIVSRTAAHTDEQFARSMARSDEQFAKAMARSEEQFARAMAHTDERFDQAMAHTDEQFARAMAHTDERFDQAMAHTDEQFARAMAHTDARFDLAEEQVRGTMMLLERMEHTLQVVAESVVLRTEGLGRIADDHERRIGDLERRVP